MGRAIMWRLMLGFAMLTVSCESSDNEGHNADTPVSLVRGNGGDPGTLDPALAEDIHAFSVLTDMYEGLVTVDASGDLVPGVAQSWDISADSMTYTFFLRENARWSNGDLISAADFVRSFQRTVAPDTASVYASLLQPIANFASVITGDMSPSDLGVTARSERVLEIRLSVPTGHWLSVLALSVALPTHVSGNAHISNGAFTLVDRQPGGPIRLQKNSLYWDAESVRVDDVTYLPIVDSMIEFNMYRSGELDITSTIPSTMVRSAVEEFGSETRIAPSLALYYLAFDLHEPPFDNLLLRQALTMAIDRQRLTSLLGRGDTPAYSIVPPGVNDYTAAEFAWKNEAKNKREQRSLELYSAAGYSPDNQLRINYLYDAGDIHETIALAISAMWRDLLGVEVTLEKREWEYFLDTRERREQWDIMRFAWFGDYNSASTFLDIFQSDSPQNLPQFRNEHYDASLIEAALQRDPSSVANFLQDAESSLLDAYPVSPLYFFASKHMVKPTISGFEDSIMDWHPSKYIAKSP